MQAGQVQGSCPGEWESNIEVEAALTQTIDFNNRMDRATISINRNYLGRHRRQVITWRQTCFSQLHFGLLVL